MLPSPSGGPSTPLSPRHDELAPLSPAAQAGDGGTPSFLTHPPFSVPVQSLAGVAPSGRAPSGMNPEGLASTLATRSVVAGMGDSDAVTVLEVGRLHNLQNYAPQLVAYFTETRYVAATQGRMMARLNALVEESIGAQKQMVIMEGRLKTMQGQMDGQASLITTLQGQVTRLEQLQDGSDSRWADLCTARDKVAAAVQVMADRQDLAQDLMGKLADVTGKLSWLCGKGIPNCCVELDSPLLYGHPIHVLTGHKHILDEVIFAVEQSAVEYHPSTLRQADYNVLDQHGAVLDLAVLDTLPHKDGMREAGTYWDAQRYWTLYEALEVLASQRQDSARRAAGIQDRRVYMSAVSLADVRRVRVAIKDGLILDVRWPTLPDVVPAEEPPAPVPPPAPHRQMGTRPPVSAAAAAVPAPPTAAPAAPAGPVLVGAPAAVILQAAPPAPVAQPLVQAAAPLEQGGGPSRPPPPRGSRLGGQADTSVDDVVDCTLATRAPPRQQQVRFPDPDAQFHIIRTTLPERTGEFTPNLLGTGYVSPRTSEQLPPPPSTIAPEIQSMLHHLQSEVQRLSAGQADSVRALEDRQYKPRTITRSMDSPCIRNNITTNEAILGMASRSAPSLTVYQREDKPMDTWSGKDSEAIPCPEMWMQLATVKAKRQNRELIDYLQDCTSGNAKLWVNNLLRYQAAHLLQQTQLEDGTLIRDHDSSSTGYTARDRKPVELLLEVTDRYVLQDFQKEWMLTRQDKTERAYLALLDGRACKQGPTDSVNDYLMAFKAAGWAAKFDPNKDILNTITIIFKGLSPAMQALGIRDKKSKQAFTTVESYTDYLLQREVDFTGVGGAASTFTPAPRPSYYPERKVMAATVDREDVDMDNEEEYEDDGDADDDDAWADHEGRVCGVKDRRGDRNRNDNRSTRGRSNPNPNPARPAPVLITVPGPGGAQGVPRPLYEFKLTLNFPSPDSIWPTGFTFVPSMALDLHPKASNIDRALKTVGVLDPNMSLSRVHHVMLRLREPTVDPNWTWCIIHGSTAHNTSQCPCVHAICPRTKAVGRT